MIRKWFLLGIMFISLVGRGQEFQLTEVIPDYTYDEVADRMSCIENEVPLVFNERVMAFVDYFAIKDREYTEDIVRKKELYFPIFSETLAKHNMPEELKYLAIVESGLRPNAISRANAVGLWQFISSTGKMYGLHSNWYVDDRMDPYEATDAAARHLRDLYNMFDSWELALAAYNCGPGNVRKAIRRSGYKREFWEIYRYLPRETRSYVPQFVAITYLFNHLEEHGFDPRAEHFYPEMDTIMISQYFHVETFCNQVGLCLDDMLLWNPQIKRGALPEGTKNFALNIPVEWKEEIVANRVSLYDTASKVGKEHLDYLARNTPGSTYGRERLYYRVRSGDVLGTIAQQYGVRVSDIRSWNGIRGNLIRVGQRLSIWVLPTYNSSNKSLYTASTPPTPKTSAPLAGGSVYTVKSGDSLWSISRNNNTSIEKLKQANRLTTNTIKPGQSLVIPN
ncbi:membrane-bound lytic murein transglycosylase D [Ekhidna lutea]|uniref:Membrane-bound lytic murein transglycosylase D n=1 Tax=Ekhidna lutea TaxID=447679 RepID=A0A239IV54_EKHLU|nr:lytic transglycosylase domain-containing protein [Ekhidna lutea]SNS97471.1 membrane-bound lytic murein transglycosylase D [Ekhidna lutea]